MSTCSICLEEFTPGPYHALGHQACIDSERVGRLLVANTELKRKLADTEEELRRVDKENFPDARAL